MRLVGDLHDRPLFICGHPKSGTTLLRAILDSHPQLIVYPDETFYFRGLLPEIKTLSTEEKSALAERYLLHFFSSDQTTVNENVESDANLNSYLRYAKTCNAMRQILTPTDYHHDGDLLSAAILAFGQVYNRLSSETLYWVEKTPYNEHYTNYIYNWWPEARCIHVVRDPRDNYATYHRKHKRLNVEEFAQSWNASLSAGLQNRQVYGKNHYRLIRYEDLTQNPEESLQEIIAFLGIRDHDLLRKPTNNGVPWAGNSMFNDKFTGISSKPTGRWKLILSPGEVNVIEAVCGGKMKKMGYSVQGNVPLITYLRLLKWNLKQAIKLPGDVSRIVKHRYGLFP
jgi:hypothetical protein